MSFQDVPQTFRTLDLDYLASIQIGEDGNITVPGPGHLIGKDWEVIEAVELLG